MGLNLGTSAESIPPTMDKVRQDFVYNIIEHASSAAGKSLEVIVDKKEWAYHDIEKYFDSAFDDALNKWYKSDAKLWQELLVSPESRN